MEEVLNEFKRLHSQANAGTPTQERLHEDAKELGRNASMLPPELGDVVNRFAGHLRDVHAPESVVSSP